MLRIRPWSSTQRWKRWTRFYSSPLFFNRFLPGWCQFEFSWALATPGTRGATAVSHLAAQACLPVHSDPRYPGWSPAAACDGRKAGDICPSVMRSIAVWLSPCWRAVYKRRHHFARSGKQCTNKGGGFPGCAAGFPWFRRVFVPVRGGVWIEIPFHLLARAE